MRIQHNIMAMNAYRNYNLNTSALSKNLEKLSSGYKINRAGDDAAGLAISEKMRAQITGLNAAQKNVKDGISLVKTAEGAMQEIQDMLNRMDYLATQSANGTYQDEVDRENLMKEVNALKTEINRIADSANFNGIKLLDGSLDTSAVPGVKYTEVKETEDVLKLFESDDFSGKNQDDADADINILETEGTGASKASFQISLDNIGSVTVKDGEAFTLKIGTEDITLDAETADKTYTAKELATALDGKTVTLTGADGTTGEFKIKAEGELLKFTSDDKVKINNQAEVTWEVAAAPAGGSLEDGIQSHADETGTVTGTGAVKEVNAAQDGSKGTGTVAGLASANTATNSNSKYDVTVGGKTYETDQTDVDEQNKAWVAAFNADSSYSAYEATYNSTDKSITITTKENSSASAPSGITFPNSGSTGAWAAGDEDVPAETITIAAGSGLATALDGASAESGAISVKYDASGNKWQVSVGDKTIDATGAVSSGVLTLSDSDGNALLTLTGSDASTATSTSYFESQYSGSTVTVTGLTYTAPGGTPPEEDETEIPEGTQNAEVDLSGISADTADPDATLSTSDVSALVGLFGDADGNTPGTATIKINNEVEIDLSGIADSYDATTTVKDLADDMLTKAQASVDAWNEANSETKGYKYTNVRISTTPDGANPGDIIAQAAGDSLYILADVEALSEDGASGKSGYINTGIQNPVDFNDGASAQVARGTVDFSEAFSDGSKIKIGDTTYTISLGKDSKFKNAENVVNLTDIEADSADLKTIAAERLAKAAEGNSIFTVGHKGDGLTTLQQKTAAKDSTDMTTKEKFASYLGMSVADAASVASAQPGKGLTLQIGDTSDAFNQMSVNVGDMHTTGMGIADVDIGTQAGAQAAVQTIKDAINYVSSVRGDLGAIQNRLEHTGNNLSVMAENIQDAESTIRDTDVAEEMMSYVKNNILVQSAQAMLAQANQLPQGVLQLLG